MFIYGCLGIIQGMFFTYLSATLSTLEKQFGIKSKESAYLVSCVVLQQPTKRLISIIYIKHQTNFVRWKLQTK